MAIKHPCAYRTTASGSSGHGGGFCALSDKLGCTSEQEVLSPIPGTRLGLRLEL